MKLSVFILPFIILIQNINAQSFLTIKQINFKKDSLPELVIANHEDSLLTRINESTIEFKYNFPLPEYLWISVDKKKHWVERVWIDMNVKERVLTIDYSSQKATLKNKTELELLLLKRDSLVRKGNFDDALVLDKTFIEKHSDSYLALWLFGHSHSVYILNNKEKLALFSKLNPSLSSFAEYKQQQANLVSRKYPNYGDTFKEFNLTDKNDKPFNSEAIKNKIIVMDFWSNTCFPCVKGMDDLVKYYNTLDTSKVAFISIALDEDREKWKKGTATQKIKWTNLWTENNSYCDLCLNYNLTAMPYFVIFNKEKKITFYNDGEDIGLIKSKVEEAMK